MSRKEFGQLVAALREELGWTQAELAEITDFDKATISSIERGTKKQLHPELMSRLSNALQLTVGERRQFFLAASGLDDMPAPGEMDGNQHPQAISSGQVLEGLVSLLGRLRIPCMLVDAYQDILALNAVIMELFQPSADLIETWRGLPGGFTTMMSVFTWMNDPAPPVSGNWENSAIANMRLFRETSLLYRARPYFKYIMREFRNARKYPNFQRYWRLAGTLPAGDPNGTQLYAHVHPLLGELKYYIFQAVTNTTDGELYLRHLAAADAHTAEAFRQVAQRADSRAIRRASWPEKQMLH
jgi:transcriptional regulator with XRE-family HTH domain